MASHDFKPKTRLSREYFQRQSQIRRSINTEDTAARAASYIWNNDRDLAFLHSLFLLHKIISQYIAQALVRISASTSALFICHDADNPNDRRFRPPLPDAVHTLSQPCPLLPATCAGRMFPVINSKCRPRATMSLIGQSPFKLESI